MLVRQVGIERWTDSRSWGPSRVRDVRQPCLGYRRHLLFSTIFPGISLLPGEGTIASRIRNAIRF